MKKRFNPIYIIKWALILVICAFSIFPILWCLCTSFKPEVEIFRTPPVWLAENPTLDHYKEILTDQDMINYFLHTLIISAGTTILTIFVSVLGGYGFARYKFKGSSALLIAILFARVLPRVAVIIPYYVTLRKLNMLNTYPGLILIYLVMCMPMSVWMLKGYFENLPKEIEEAAVVDGCSSFGVLRRIVLPMCAPIIATVAMNAFILSWNEFLYALTMTDGKSMRTIAIGLAFFIDEFGVHWGPLMAASVLMSIPAILFFSLAQNSMVRGLSAGAVKG